MKRFLILSIFLGFSFFSFGQDNNQLLEEIIEQIAEENDEELDYGELYEALYYFAENLEQREKSIVDLLVSLRGVSSSVAKHVFSLACERIFYYASMADKFEGQVHNPPMRGLTLALKENLGVLAIILSDHDPLLSLVTCMSAAFATGNAQILVPSQKTSLLATELYQVLDTSDVPGGYINILTAKDNELNSTLSKHENIDGIWYFGNSQNSQTDIIKNSTSNLKRYWCPKEKNIEESLNKIVYDVENHIDKGVNIIILSDRNTSKKNSPIPMLLACSFVHHSMIKKNKRSKFGIIIESAEDDWIPSSSST